MRVGLGQCECVYGGRCGGDVVVEYARGLID